MAASLGWRAHNCVDAIFLEIERSTVVVKWRVDPKSRRAAIQAILAKDFEHAHLLYFKLQRPNAVNIVLINC
jgi:hypothetical protein